jgi:hypothetical protein
MPATTETIEIPLNKKKILLLFAGTLVFFSVCAWIAIGRSTGEENISTKLAVFSYAGLLLFGFIGISLSKKLFVKHAGLIIDDNGIVDNAGGLAGEYILWSDIENITRFEIQGQNLVMIQVKNPQFYIDRESSFLKRKAMALNLKLYGTPVCISANTLSTSFNTLYATLQAGFYKKKQKDAIVE